ncbi:hypothetical protein EDB92DRAFT_189586 [Lactarius akahatsu]|uniref:Uncharacterized protein n=1 Tax=Lactarius akahatsu TaxID=416441 RepID=A0AAD4L5M7_9AGAM|nr:hypothetical protein EDB92DRAFT_189586 [Lactarius akahatsu]
MTRWVCDWYVWSNARNGAWHGHEGVTRTGTSESHYESRRDEKTASVSIEGQAAQWGQKLDAFYVQLSSHLVLCLYVEQFIGMHQILIPVESQIDIPVVLSNGDGRAGQSVQPIMTLTVSADANTTNAIASEVDGSPTTHPSDPRPYQRRHCLRASFTSDGSRSHRD